MNPFDMIKNIKNLQANMQEMQEKMKEITETGSSGGDMVRVTVNGEMEIVDIFLSPEVVDPKDITMLQDLIRAAHSDAMVKIKEKVKQEMMNTTGGVMPPGFPGM